MKKSPEHSSGADDEGDAEKSSSTGTRLGPSPAATAEQKQQIAAARRKCRQQFLQELSSDEKDLVQTKQNTLPAAEAKARVRIMKKVQAKARRHADRTMRKTKKPSFNDDWDVDEDARMRRENEEDAAEEEKNAHTGNGACVRARMCFDLLIDDVPA